MNRSAKIKDFFKYFMVVLVCLVCMVVYNLCATQPSIVSITKGESNGVYDTYIVKYSNGKADSITIKNGEDGKGVTVNDLYLATKTALNKGDDYTLLEFINDYMNYTVEERDETKAYVGALSTVEVYCEFPTTIEILTNKKGYSLSTGAGVIYQSENDLDSYYIITNYHVVYNRESISTNNIATKITCFLYGSNVEITQKNVNSSSYSYTYGPDGFNCEYIAGSMENDIAVLKVTNPNVITNSSAKAVKVCKDDPVIGETVVAIGNPQGLGTSVTKGIVSVDSEYMTMKASDNVTKITFRAIRIDAPINGGNSGGGLFNTNGELIGIVNSKLQATEIEGMAFALPVNNCIRVVEKIIKNSKLSEPIYKATKPKLGISLKINSSKAVYNAETNSIKIVEKIEVDSVDSNSISAGKLFAGDIINSVTIDAVTYEIDRDFRLTELVWLMEKDKVITINVTRLSNNEIVNLVITQDCIASVD